LSDIGGQVFSESLTALNLDPKSRASFYALAGAVRLTT
jgi:hypothetical protein